MTAPQVRTATVPTPYSAVDPTSKPTGEHVICPYVLCVRADLYEPVFGLAIDDVTGEWKGSKTLRRMANLYLPHLRGLALIAT